MGSRTNDEWLHQLGNSGPQQYAALNDLREYLFRAVFLYLRDRRSDLADLPQETLRSMADDFAQEALEAIRANLDSFRGDAKFTTWAYRFVINAAAGELRRRQYHGQLSWDSLSDQERHALMSTTQTKGLDPDLAVERQEMLRLLLHIIHTELNEQQRQAVLMVHFEGRSMQEVAEYLHTSTNTLYKTLFDARKKLKANLLARHLSGGDLLALFEVWL